MKKSVITAAILTSILATAIAFDWPQNEILSNSFNSYFGQLRGNHLNTSLVFSDSEEIKVCEDGRVLASISEHDETTDLFESTLGNSIIIAHKDNIMTVYGNLDSENQDERSAMTTVTTGTNLGTCSNSAWQENDSCLEFKVIDSQNKLFINPRVLMPRVGAEAELSIKGVVAVNKKGVEYDLFKNDSIPSGTYTIYQQRQKISLPYKTTIFINGYSVEQISYATLIQKDGKICTEGKHNYTSQQIYPSNDRFLLGEIVIPRGKIKMTVISQDILGKEKQITFNFTAR